MKKAEKEGRVKGRKKRTEKEEGRLCGIFGGMPAGWPPIVIQAEKRRFVPPLCSV